MQTQEEKYVYNISWWTRNG